MRGLLFPQKSDLGETPPVAPVLDFLAHVSPVLLGRLAADPTGRRTLFEELPAIAEETWKSWAEGRPQLRRRADLEAIANASADTVEEAIHEILDSVPANYPQEVDRALTDYLRLVGPRVRRVLRRPSDPAGTTFAAGTLLVHPTDLLPFLPPRLTHFRAGETPPGIDDWELVEVLGIAEISEIWQARARQGTEERFATLEFLLDEGAGDRLADQEAVINRVIREADHPGMVPLHHVYYYSDPPCLRSEFRATGDLAGWLTDAESAEAPPTPFQIGQIVRRVAEIVAYAHRLSPPLMHGDLRPGNLLARRQESGGTEWQVAGWGAGGLRPRSAMSAQARRFVALGMGRLSSAAAGRMRLPLYAPPQQIFGETPDPSDDVFALGVLWFQLLSGNLAQGRPGGARWRQRLSLAGVTPPMIALLEACFEDERQYRPADAGVLVERLDEVLRAMPPVHHSPPAPREPPTPALLPPATPLTVAAPPEVKPAVALAGETAPRPRPRRLSVDQMYQRLEQAAPELPKAFSNEVGCKLVWIPAGKFMMGSDESETGRRSNEGPLHEVILSKPFFMSVYPVTRGQYERVMGAASALTSASSGPDQPVVGLLRGEAIAFCDRLSAMDTERSQGRVYRLPTEAEWEYACRSGTTTPFWNGEALSAAQANFHGQFPYGFAPRGPFLQSTTPVGAYPPNAFGLHDMHGNVWEWCSDWYDSDYYRRSPKLDPKGPERGQFGVVRGGCWRNHASSLRAAYRNALVPEQRDPCTGFRVVCPAPAGGRS